METNLHKALKTLYAGDTSPEVPLETYRVDAIRDDLLIEVQCAGLAALRDKLHTLLPQHRVLVVKPLIRSTHYIHRRYSKVVETGTVKHRYGQLRIFDELVHWTKLFPHKNLTLEILEIDQWEHRRPPSRGWRRKHRVEGRALKTIYTRHHIETAHDLLSLLRDVPDGEFDTQQLAKANRIPRWLAQKIAYVLRAANVIEQVGKRGNAAIYQLQPNATGDRLAA